MLNILVNNPFRVLGVYSNAKPADIVSNCDDLDAYLAIGQSVSFDLDYNNILPVVNRTQEIVNQAKSKINLPKDKLKHALFWFIKDSSSTHAMNYLKNGDFNNADNVFDIEDSFATRINKAVTALMQNNVGSAIAYVTEMIHDFDEQGFRDDFVKAICGDTYSIGENELAQLFIDTLLEENSASELRDLFQKHGVSQDDDDYLTEKAVDVPISRINTEIAKAKAVNRNDANANYQAGKALMESTKTDLGIVKSLLETSDMRYQMLADDLANTILQCGINYFNNTENEDKIEKALKLQKYACKIAVGKICKDRCNENLAILMKQKEEQAITTDIEFIVNELKAFQNRASSIDNVKSFLNNCQPHLIVIKNQLGNTNALYLKISTAVANNALGMVVDIVNNASTSNITSYKHLLESAIGVVDYIDHKIDKTKQEELRLLNNASTLQELHMNAVLAEVSQTNQRKNNSGGCYIATMCYGDYDHPQVMVLRDFRDSVLLQHSWGKSFVRFYYHHSPKWVEHLKDKRIINMAIRKILDNFIILYKDVKK